MILLSGGNPQIGKGDGREPVQGWFFSMHCMTRYVKVTWLNGGELDPPPPETLKYPAVRYSNIGRDDEIDDDRFRDWIRQAATIPGDETF